MSADLRALAEGLDRRPRVRVETRGSQRTEGDCLRVAVAEAYGRVHDFGYGDTPAVPGYVEAGFQARWEAWAIERGLRWWASCELAPVHLAAWIGEVDSKEVRGALHAIPFSYERPILPAETKHAGTTIDQVRVAKWLLPAGVGMPDGRLRRIINPAQAEPKGIVHQDPDSPSGWRRVA